MKPGCFLKTIIVLTILIAAILYIIQHKSGLFFEPGKKIVAGMFMDQWDKDFKFVRDTPEKSVLKNSLEKYFKDLKYEDIKNDTDMDRIVDMIKDASKDSVISKYELTEILNKLFKKNKNERPE